MAMKTITSESFAADVSNATKPVLVDFWAEWCGPCKTLSPLLDELSNEFGDRVVMGKVNVDDHPEVGSQFGIRSIPTMIIFRDGKPHAMKVGALPRAQLQSWIEGAIA